MKKLKTLVLICMVLVVAMIGCNNMDEQGMKDSDIVKEERGTGGKVDRSDYNAPKEIKSENLISFSCNYFLYGELGREFDSSYGISVKKNSDGKYILCGEVHDISCDTNEEYLRKVQKIIKENNFASINGVNSYTNGLPSEFQPCYFSAEYDSGEKIYFSVDNNPQSNWGKELLRITQAEFTAHGITDINPPIETSVVTRFILSYTDADICYNFSEIEVPVEGVHKSIEELATEGFAEGEYETKIQYQIWNRADNSEIRTYRADIDETYYKGLGDVISQSNIYEFASPSGAPAIFNHKDVKTYYEFFIEYEYGNTLCGFSDVPDMNNKFAPVADEIATYIKSYLGVE